MRSARSSHEAWTSFTTAQPRALLEPKWKNSAPLVRPQSSTTWTSDVAW